VKLPPLDERGGGRGSRSLLLSILLLEGEEAEDMEAMDEEAEGPLRGRRLRLRANRRRLRTPRLRGLEGGFGQ